MADGAAQQQQFENDTATRNLKVKDYQTQIAAQAKVDADKLAEEQEQARWDAGGKAVNAKLVGADDRHRHSSERKSKRPTC